MLQALRDNVSIDRSVLFEQPQPPFADRSDPRRRPFTLTRKISTTPASASASGNHRVPDIDLRMKAACHNGCLVASASAPEERT